ncbi:hypothetical protein [Haloarchaeobius sp. HME9146]|uniref:hypothetical protein n=1 Tax=Haloarchaeobius sp. HME9146 TaxID=2978732 RepID=UPI0021C18EB3|nr:hypothetical protein [Haloarchaeobius sp. HME9146]MCT9096569.1 hypothetical protein [Haloarchaeobius sp. HME9146]
MSLSVALLVREELLDRDDPLRRLRLEPVLDELDRLRVRDVVEELADDPDEVEVAELDDRRLELDRLLLERDPVEPLLLRERDRLELELDRLLLELDRLEDDRELVEEPDPLRVDWEERDDPERPLLRLLLPRFQMSAEGKLTLRFAT